MSRALVLFQQFLEKEGIAGEKRKQLKEISVRESFIAYLKLRGYAESTIQKTIKAFEKETGGDYPFADSFFYDLTPSSFEEVEKMKVALYENLSKMFQEKANKAKGGLHEMEN